MDIYIYISWPGKINDQGILVYLRLAISLEMVFQIEHLSENTQVSSCLGAKIQGFEGSQGTRIDPEDPKQNSSTQS